ncbi:MULTISPECIES: polyamine ABC transporter substrate-binding protein [Thermomonospora]|uniref:Extracellular solute-binding protein family 1 n=1 Tax=Thermomonospora curvata (strain ATCC 19995 / DSM 43183 / JCM 3096 / KCTC 9072 / NBRC 15933 / NCIMB 10081 / Henssen B9) TaxID=471852 RepID=D1AAZ0_THECD|nr:MULTISPECIES: spermidine/putrescine ABC transporter substrate-binding protein [Thermomonospora]ACY98933.1 extracellular solute-binding protein family 1 [Thermomonospora curvata DSM 43183]PKK13130.1 MAG: spermidine/putrescine ABC transporter substrate-binding protein [Thermomonospora sp. CIF 1]
MSRRPNPGDPAFLRGLTRPRLRGPVTGRRDVLRLLGATGAGLALAACGVEGQGGKQNVTQSDVQKYWEGKTKNGVLNWANWPGYMEEDRATLKAFTKATGIKVNYQEVIQENAEWFGKIEAPLRAGQSIDFDLMVMTNGLQLEKLRQLGYLAPLDHSKLPNFAENAGESFKNPSYDPGNTFTVPFMAGITGIAYNTKYVKEEITSIASLWDPKYKGKIGMMADSQELGNFGMFAIGVDPEKSTPDDWRKAAAKLREQKDLVRKYYNQDYADAIAKGDVWITMAWSGDVYSLGLEDVKFVVPEEGGTLWTDNMCIPKTAANPVDAIMLMDWLYDPRANAGLTEYINYITPVPAVQEIVKQDAAKAKGEKKADLERLASSPLVFPTERDLAKLRRYRVLTTAEESEYQKIFTPIAQGA